MKQVQKNVPLNWIEKHYALVAFSWNVYDVSHDTFTAIHNVVMFTQLSWGVQKTLFEFGSISKRDAFLKQVSEEFGVVDFDLVDYSKKTQAKLKSRFAANQKLDSSCSSYDIFVTETLLHEPGYNVSAYVPQELDYDSILAKDLDMYLYKGALRADSDFHWNYPIFGSYAAGEFSSEKAPKSYSLETICFACGNTGKKDDDICQKCLSHDLHNIPRIGE